MYILWFMVGWVACDIAKSLILQVRRDLRYKAERSAREYARIPRSRYFVVRWWRSYNE